MQFALARRFAVEVKRYAAGPTQERQLAWFTWLIGTPVIIIITLIELMIAGTPAIHFVPVLAYSVAFGVFAPMQFIFSGKVTNRLEKLRLVPVNVGAVVIAAGW